MAIEITETFQVEAPVDAVWRFMLDPNQVVTCMPGAQLEEVVDDRTFLGSVKVKLGAITTSYKGLQSQLTSLPDGGTEVLAQASVDLTGRVMQMGRGMIQGVSHQLFQQFVASTRERLEAEPGAAPELAPAESTPIRAIPLLLSTLRAAIVGFFRRLFGQPNA